MGGTSILVTGAGGFIGNRLVRRLVESGHQVTALDSDSARLASLAERPGTGALRTVACDIVEASAVDRVVATAQPQAVVHLVAEHVIPWCEAGPTHAVTVNLDGLVNVLAEIGQSPTKRVVFASTADVYAPSHGPLREDDPLGPSSVYGASKLLGERLVAEWERQGSGRHATSVRIFNVYGPGDGNPHVIPEMLHGLAADEPIRLGNRRPSRDYIYVDDVVEVICQVLEAPLPPRILNAGTGVATSVAGLVTILRGLVARPFDWIEDSAKMRAVDRPHLQADTTRMARLLPDFLPRPLEVGLRETLELVGIPQRHSSSRVG